MFSSLQIPEVYKVNYHKIILKIYIKEDLNFPFCLLDLYLKLFPSAFSFFTLDLLFQLTPDHVHFTCPQANQRQCVLNEINYFAPNLLINSFFPQ